jgi:hypothetical protein
VAEETEVAGAEETEVGGGEETEVGGGTDLEGEARRNGGWEKNLDL